MATQVRNRFRILLAEKEVREGRSYTYEDIQEKTGLAPRTIANYATGKVQRFDASTLETLCDWFGCDLSDLLEYPPETSQQALELA